MKEESINPLLQTRTSKKEVERIKTQIEIKKKRLRELAQELEQDQKSVELSIHYLLLKREIERLTRVVRILEREETREIENAWIKENKAEEPTEYLQKFKEITNKYYSHFPVLNFSYRDVPVEYYVHVLALEECGVIEMGDSLVETKKGSLYFVRKKEILHLLAGGLMKIVKTESKRLTR